MPVRHQPSWKLPRVLELLTSGVRWTIARRSMNSRTGPGHIGKFIARQTRSRAVKLMAVIKRTVPEEMRDEIRSAYFRERRGFHSGLAAIDGAVSVHEDVLVIDENGLVQVSFNVF